MRSSAADIDEVMYSCGARVLHPGGTAVSAEMADKCGIKSSSRVLEIGAGKGATAVYLAKHIGCTVTGVDLSEKMLGSARLAAAETGLSGQIDFIKADALSLPFEDESFDTVLAECAVTLTDRRRAAAEFMRVVKPGGYIGDLEMIWQKPPPEEAAAHLKRLWGGFETDTLPGWTGFYSSFGLKGVSAVDFSSMMPDMGRDLLRQLGAAGVIRLAVKLLCRPPLLRSMMEYRKAFNRYNQYIGYAYFTGRKPV